MSILGAAELVEFGTAAIKRIWPDKDKQAEEIRKLEEISQTSDLAYLNAYVRITLAQIEVNNEAAKSKSMFAAGPRPFIIWTGGVSLAYSGVVHPLFCWIWALLQALEVIPKDAPPPPILEAETLNHIVMGLLGVAGMRSFDKVKGTQTDRIKM